MFVEGEGALSFAAAGCISLTIRSIDDCPICGYSLEGLPAVHRCPECFFEYDEFTHAWTNKKLATWAIVFSPFAGVMVYFVVREIHRNSWWNDPLMLILVVMLFLAFAYRIFKMKRLVGTREIVCVHGGGLLIRSHTQGEKNYTWEELRAIGTELIGAP